MSTIINATTANGVVIQPDNSGSLQLATNNGTTAVTIDTSQNVGIGTTTPLGTAAGRTVLTVNGTSTALLNLGLNGTETFSLYASTTANITAVTNIPLTFATNNTERMRIDTSGNIKLSTSGTTIQNSSGRPILNQSGSILQVKSTTLSSTFTSSTGNAWTDITGLSVSITPSSTSSTILVRYVVAGVLFRPTLNGVGVRVVRGSTAIGVGNASGSILQIGSSSAIVSNDSQQTAAWEFLDTPASTSAQTYQVQFYQDTPANPLYINRSASDPNQGGRSISTITVMEVSA